MLASGCGHTPKSNSQGPKPYKAGTSDRNYNKYNHDQVSCCDSSHQTELKSYDPIDSVSTISQHETLHSCSSIFSSENGYGSEKCLRRKPRKNNIFLYHCSICSENKKRQNVDKNEDADIKNWCNYIEKLEEIQFSKIKFTPSNQINDKQECVDDHDTKLRLNTKGDMQYNYVKSQTKINDRRYSIGSTRNNTHSYKTSLDKSTRNINLSINDIIKEMTASSERNFNYILFLLVFDIFICQWLLRNIIIISKRNLQINANKINENFRYLLHFIKKSYENISNFKLVVSNKKGEIYKMVKKGLLTITYLSPNYIKLKKRCQCNEQPLESIANELREIKEVLLFYKNNSEYSNGTGETFLERLQFTTENLGRLSSVPPPPPPPPPPMSPLSAMSDKKSNNENQQKDSSLIRPTITVEDLRSVQLRKTSREIKLDESVQNKCLHYIKTNTEPKERRDMRLNMLKSNKQKIITNKAKNIKMQ